MLIVGAIGGIGLAVALVSALVVAHADEPIKYVYASRLTKHPLTGERHRHVAAMMSGNRIGLFGGFGVLTVEIFDLETETFRLLPIQRRFGDLSGISLANGKVLLVDGKDCEFDPVTETFVRSENTFSGYSVRWASLQALPDGRVFVCGGFDGRFKPIDNCSVYCKNCKSA